MKILNTNDKMFSEGFEESLESFRVRNLRSETIKHYEEPCKSIIKFLEKDTSIKDINKSTVNDFIAYCKKI